MSPVNRRGQDIRTALAGEEPVRRIITICGWCPDAREQTLAARAHGFDVSHTMCSLCTVKFEAGATA